MEEENRNLGVNKSGSNNILFNVDGKQGHGQSNALLDGHSNNPSIEEEKHLGQLGATVSCTNARTTESSMKFEGKNGIPHLTMKQRLRIKQQQENCNSSAATSFRPAEENASQGIQPKENTSNNNNNIDCSMVATVSLKPQLKGEETSVATEVKPMATLTQQDFRESKLCNPSKEASKITAHSESEIKLSASAKPSSSMDERLHIRRPKTESAAFRVVPLISANVETLQNKKQDGKTLEDTPLKLQANLYLPKVPFQSLSSTSVAKSEDLRKPLAARQVDSIKSNIDNEKEHQIVQKYTPSPSAYFHGHVQNHPKPPIINSIHANAQSSETLTSIKSIYLNSLLSTVASVTIQELLQKQWNIFQFKAEAQLDASKLIKSKDSEEVKRSLEHLSTFVWELLFEKIVFPLDLKFQESICFWGNELDIILKNYNFTPQSFDFPSDFPDELISTLMCKIQFFHDNMKERNLAIQKLENSAIQAVMNEAIIYFQNESIFALGSQYLEDESLRQLTKRIEAETLYNFNTAVKVSGSSNQLWGRELGDRLCSMECRTKILQRNQINKKSIEGRFSSEMKKCVEVYREKLQDYCQSQRQNRKGFWNDIFIKTQFGSMERRQRQILLDNFDKLATSNSINSRGIFNGFRNQLVDTMDKIKDENLTQLLYQIQKQQKEEEEMQKQRELKRLEAERKAKEESEREKKSAMSKAHDGHHYPTRVQNDGTKSKSVILPPSTFPRMTTTGEDADGLKSLPSAILTFHVGLNKTKVGVTDNYGNFRVLDNVENVLYYVNSSDILVPWKPNSSKSISFKGLLMKNSVDKKYDIKINSQDLSFRLESLLAILLNALKFKAQFQLRKFFNRALVVVPQSLNHVQRRAVQDAGKLAGFEEAYLINDTTAMVFALIFTTEHPPSQKAVAINCFEGFIDAGLFTQQDRNWTCEKMLGDFIRHEESWAISIKQVVSNATSSLAGWFFTGGDRASTITYRNIKNVLRPLKEIDQTTNIVIGCLAEDREKFFGIPRVPFMKTVNNSYALSGAAAFVSMVNCPSQENSVFCSWLMHCEQNEESAESKDGLKSLDILWNDHIDDGTKTMSMDHLENPEHGKNLDSKMIDEIKKSSLYTRMKYEEDACLHLLKLASNLEIKLINSLDGPRKKSVREQLQCLHLQWKEVNRLGVAEIRELQDAIKKLENELS